MRWNSARSSSTPSSSPGNVIERARTSLSAIGGAPVGEERRGSARRSGPGRPRRPPGAVSGRIATRRWVSPSWAWTTWSTLRTPSLQLAAQVAQHGAALPGLERVERGGGEVEHDDREQRLVAAGPGHLEVGLVEEVAGVVEPGLVVDLVVELELLEGALQHLRRPPAHRTEDEVGGRARHDQPGELPHADGVDGGIAQAPRRPRWRPARPPRRPPRRGTRRRGRSARTAAWRPPRCCRRAGRT